METQLQTQTERSLANADDPGRIGWLTPTNIEAGLRLAELMAKAKLVPEHLRGSAGDCLLVIAQAISWRMNPISVAQCTAVVRGKLCYEGKLVSAVLTSLGAIEGRLSYDYHGEGQGMSVTITGIPRGGKSVSITGTVKGWRTENKMWDSDPMSMLNYRGTRQWARLFAPEAMLGVMTPDEADGIENDTGAIPATAKHVVVTPGATTAEKPKVETVTDPQPQAEPAKPAAAPKKNGNGTNPAIAKAKELYDALPADSRASVLGRINGLFGVKNAKDIPPGSLEKYGQIAADMLSLLPEHGVQAILDNLTSLEAEMVGGAA
jgi:hypothetical protein